MRSRLRQPGRNVRTGPYRLIAEPGLDVPSALGTLVGVFYRGTKKHWSRGHIRSHGRRRTQYLSRRLEGRRKRVLRDAVALQDKLGKVWSGSEKKIRCWINQCSNLICKNRADYDN